MKWRTDQAPRKYEPQSTLLALDPKAFIELFMVPASRDNEERDNVTIIDIRGPLEQHDTGWCDSYEAILGRVQAACDRPQRDIVLRIDSPGGDVAGCFETVGAIRAKCTAAGKRLYAFVDGRACSGGYALACAAEAITLSDTALVGSIGVISTRQDFSMQNAARGVRVALVTSGARKADGHPDQAITDDELAATQVVVDSLAGEFFALVAAMRPTTSVEKVRGLDAGIFHGQAAVGAGLADDVQPFESMLALIASGNGGNNMAAKSSYETAHDALEDAAKGDDANAAAAKRALAAMDAGPESEADASDDSEGDEKPPKKDGDEEKAESDAEPDGDEPPKKKKDEEATASVHASQRMSATAAAGELATVVSEQGKQIAMLMKANEANGMRALFKSRPDIEASVVKVLSKMSLADATAVVQATPRKTAKPAATATVQATRGASQGASEVSGPAPVSEINPIDRAMGLTQTKLGVRREGTHALIFGPIETPFERPAATSGTAGGAK